MGSLVLLTGTGTEIGKTHLGCSLLRVAAARGVRAFGYKPVESGVIDERASDAARLRDASTFHVKHAPVSYSFRAAVGPHVAARQKNTLVDVTAVVSACAALRAEVPFCLVELPGGLFSPFTDALLNADIAREIAPDAIVLVAADRLGVLHDVNATLEAASARGLVKRVVVLLSAPRAEVCDASTGTNDAFLAARHTGVDVFSVPRAPADELAAGAALRAAFDALV